MKGSILVVDDSLTVRMDLSDAFQSAGFPVVPCATAAEARRALAEGRVALAILDVLLPDADGVDLLQEIRSTPALAGLRVMILATQAEVKDRIRGLQTGADEYVGKPYDTSYVVARARQLLSGREGDAAPDRASILIVDDSPTYREELARSLAGAGYAVLSAGSGEEGLHIAAATRPTGILVDGVMPGMDGATLIRRVRLDAALRGTPCVLLTAAEGRDSELLALDAGADAFVRKDEEIEVILARLAAVLRSAGGSRAQGTASLVGLRKVLAVDDSPTYLAALAAVLQGEGYDVVLAHSGEEALDLLAVQAVDCILLDVVMPGLGGRETCLRIKASPGIRDVPLLLLTSLEDRDAVIEGLSTGADDFISKSSDFEVVKARVRAQIRRKQFEDENRRIREELLRSELEASEARADRELAEMRSKLVEELERKNKELESFSYSVSHDLRAPLRSIDGFSHILEEEYGATLDETAKRYLRRIRSAAHRMGELIDDLLELSRVGRTELSVEAVDLSRIAEQAAAELQRRSPDRDVSIEIQSGLRAEADGRLMRVVLENLLENAWKFTAKSRGATIRFTAEPAQDNGPVYCVRDNGAGFDQTYAGKLFRPFERLHREADFPGTGIGLATVYRIINRHGGHLWAEGETGRGAAFFFSLPGRTRA
jgi:DNA-binding response OmpR family regulator